MPLNLTPDFLIFSLVFIIGNYILDLFSKKFLHIDGTDFLFFAPWLAAIKFGVYEGVILAAVILVLHAFMHMRIARFIVLSFPTQILAVFFGYLFGIEGFWVTLVVYYVASTAVTGLLGGIGGMYFMFLLANSITNIIAFFVYQALF